MNKYFIETFGCQMNKYDSELIASILEKSGYKKTDNVKDSDVILINTCSVREHAENRVRGKLDSFRILKKRNQNLIIGILGCMAQRLGHNLIEEKPIINFVIGPDRYRILPTILEDVHRNSITTYDVLIDDEETYSDISPARAGKVSAWVAIMRGCNNFCSYCIVPYVRGRERSRSLQSILIEVNKLVKDGYVEVTLLGQNVNSYHDDNKDFADLLYEVSQISGIKRVRFATSHPKDLSLKLVETIANNDRLCNHIHLPIQSGSNKILKLMNRNYTREHYLSLVECIRRYIKQPGLYTDIIVGFPGETEQDFRQTYELVQQVQFDGIFSFKYSPRKGTTAYQYKETVTAEEKKERLQRLNQLQHEITLQRNRQLIGTNQKILVEGSDKKGKQNQLMGRTDTNKIVVFPNNHRLVIGTLIDVKIINTEGHTLFGEIN